jgi:hypothetical protein
LGTWGPRGLGSEVLEPGYLGLAPSLKPKGHRPHSHRYLGNKAPRLQTYGLWGLGSKASDPKPLALSPKASDPNVTGLTGSRCRGSEPSEPKPHALFLKAPGTKASGLGSWSKSLGTLVPRYLWLCGRKPGALALDNWVHEVCNLRVRGFGGFRLKAWQLVYFM